MPMGSCHWTDFFTALAQLDRALDYESGGWEFESLRWYHFLLGIGVVVAQETLNLSVQVQFLYPLPDIPCVAQR